MIRDRLLVVTALGALAAVLAPACSEDVASSPTTSSSSSGTGGEGGATTTSSSSGGAGGTGGDGGAGGASPPITCEVTPTTGVVLALSKLYIGNKDPDDTPNEANGWRQYGFDIDGLISTDQSQDLCQPNSGAPPSTPYPDGDAGIDNSFGRNILPILLSLDENADVLINDTLQAGEGTLLLHLADLGPDADQAPIAARLYGGAKTAATPVFDGADCWPVSPESLQDPADITTPRVSFDQSALAGNAWTSGSTGTVVLSLPVAGFPLVLTIHEARLTFNLSADHVSAGGGQLGGVLDTEEFAAAIRTLAGSFDASLCDGAALEGILAQIRQASDILADGTQDPAVTCSGISIGLGFELSQVSLGSIAPITPPAPDPCAAP